MIRVFPMNQAELAGQSAQQYFLYDLQTVSAHRPQAGRFNFAATGIVAPTGSLVLFQYQARLVAHAELVSRHPADQYSASGSKGWLLLNLATLRCYKNPIPLDELLQFWPSLRFDQRKRALDPSKRAVFLAFARNR